MFYRSEYAEFFPTPELVCRTYGMWSICVTGNREKRAGVKKSLRSGDGRTNYQLSIPERSSMERFRPAAPYWSLDYLRREHYPKYHRPLRECSALAQRIYQRLRLDPLTTGSLRAELNMARRPERNRFDRALHELQVTLNIARRNSLEDENDTWVLFSDQYLDLVQAVDANNK
jgi:hypothetical protein